MPTKYAVRTCRFESGERFPVLIERGTGLPLFDPLVFMLSVLRARNLASSTISQANRALIVLHLFLDQREIDLDSRLESGMLLSFSEIDLLVRNCRIFLDQLEPLRTGNVRTLKQINAESTAGRCIYIRDYLEWLVQDRLLQMRPEHPYFASLTRAMEMGINAITARIPYQGSQSTVSKREGLSVEDVDQLRQTIGADATMNPWKGQHVRLRNALVIEFLLALGLRRGELLNIKISDC